MKKIKKRIKVAPKTEKLSSDIILALIDLAVDVFVRRRWDEGQWTL